MHVVAWHAGVLHGRCGRRVTPHEIANQHERGHRQQCQHQEVGHFFAHAQVGEQRSQSKTRRETGDRAHPTVFLGRGSGRGSGLLALGCGSCCLFGRRCTLHAKRFAAAHALGFGVVGG